MSDKDSDAEFEQMLKEAEEVSKEEEAPSTPASVGPRKKAKTKIGNKYRKKGKGKKPGAGKNEDEEVRSIEDMFCVIANLIVGCFQIFHIVFF